MSAAIKILLIFLLGATVRAVLLFEILVVSCAQFQHSSLRVPVWFETLLWPLFVPPSMHRIHHSVVVKERNSNYGTILSVWDRILGTLITDADQKSIRIGIGAYYKYHDLGLRRLLLMPFTRPVL